MLTRRRFIGNGTVFAASLGLPGDRLGRLQALPRLRQVTLRLPGLPAAWDGLTIAQVSDVHAGPYMPVSRMRRIRDVLADLPVDVVVFTGDQLDRRPEDARRFAEGFRGLRAPLGAFGILGNHDHQVGSELAVSALERAGVTPLVNQSVELDRDGWKLALIGVDDLQASYGNGPDFGLLRRHPDAFRICLCHQPQGWIEAHAGGAHLTLAGHTHGGQIALTSRNLNVARLQTRYIAGPYRRDDGFLYVSRGVGVGAVPLRVGAPAEIDVLTLRRPVVGARAAA